MGRDHPRSHAVDGAGHPPISITRRRHPGCAAHSVEPWLTTKSARQLTPGASWAAGIALGIGIGVALGVAMGNIAVGVGMGIGIGVAFALAFGRSAAKPSGGSSGSPAEGDEPDSPSPTSD